MLWLDSSGRAKPSNMNASWVQILTKTHGVLMLSRAGVSNFAVTHPQMYHYLPSNQSELKRTRMMEAGAELLYRTHLVYNNVIKWWVLCALDQKCIAPITDTRCTFPTPAHSFTVYANCHRFDQSAINILLANLYDFDESLYYAKDKLVDIRRGSRRLEGKLENC